MATIAALTTSIFLFLRHREWLNSLRLNLQHKPIVVILSIDSRPYRCHAPVVISRENALERRFPVPLLKCLAHYNFTFAYCCALEVLLMHPAAFQILKIFRGLMGYTS